MPTATALAPTLAAPTETRQVPYSFVKLQHVASIKATRGEPTANGRPTLNVAGWASTEDVDRTNEVIHSTFFAESLDQFRANPRMFWQHQVNIGVWDQVEVAQEGGVRGLRVSGRIIDLSDAGDGLSPYAMAQVEEGMVRAMSVGFNIAAPRMECGYREGDVWHWVRNGQLMEVSLVDMPCNPGAIIDAAKSLHLSLRSLDEFDGEDAEEARVRADLKRLTGAAESLRNISRHWAKTDGGALSAEVLTEALSPISVLAELAKAGRVLSGANRTAVEAARDALNEVIARDDASRASTEDGAGDGKRLPLVRCTCGEKTGVPAGAKLLPIITRH
ncbi:MAG: hypothetical protein GYA36_23030 [Veillonellaceae bacterium]|nr:hypothetical protein [Veillonellaceae bacterium]